MHPISIIFELAGNRQRRLDGHRFGRYIKKSLYANMLGPRGVQITKMFGEVEQYSLYTKQNAQNTLHSVHSKIPMNTTILEVGRFR